MTEDEIAALCGGKNASKRLRARQTRMIERVALAIGILRDKYGAAGPSDKELAHAAIAAMREPTNEMWEAVNESPITSLDWQAMIDAALEEK